MPKPSQSGAGRQTTQKPPFIQAIFTNVLFVIGVIMVVVGFVQTSTVAIKTATFGKYPLPSYEEDRCSQQYGMYAAYGTEPAMMPIKPIDAPDMMPTPTPTPDQSQAKQACEQQLERDRKLRQTEDTVTAVTVLISGAVMSVLFKKFI